MINRTLILLTITSAITVWNPCHGTDYLSEYLAEIGNNHLAGRQLETFRNRFTEGNRISAHTRYADLYRHYVRDTRYAIWLEHNTGIEGCYRFSSSRRKSLALYAQSGVTSRLWENPSPQSSLNINVADLTNTFRLSLANIQAHGSVGVDLSASLGEGDADYNIQNYPTSDNKNVNEYFYDLLPAAFGYSFSGKKRTESFSASLFAHLKPFPSAQMNTGIMYHTFSASYRLGYINSMEDTPYSGHRKLLQQLTSTHVLIYQDITWMLSRATVCFEGGIFLTNLRISLIPKDLPQVGSVIVENRYFVRCRMYSPGVFMNLKYTISDLSASCGLGYRSLDALMEFQTPILRYPILISHSAYLSPDGSLPTVMGGLDYSARFRNISLKPELSVILGRLTIDGTGDAELEFGLVTTPIDEIFKFNITIFQLLFPVEISFSPSVTCTYEFSQTVPVIHRVDDNPIRLKPKVTQPGKKLRGGSIHSIKLYYVFN